MSNATTTDRNQTANIHIGDYVHTPCFEVDGDDYDFGIVLVLENDGCMATVGWHSGVQTMCPLADLALLTSAEYRELVAS